MPAAPTQCNEYIRNNTTDRSVWVILRVQVLSATVIIVISCKKNLASIIRIKISSFSNFNFFLVCATFHSRGLKHTKRRITLSVHQCVLHCYTNLARVVTSLAVKICLCIISESWSPSEIISIIIMIFINVWPLLSKRSMLMGIPVARKCFANCVQLCTHHISFTSSMVRRCFWTSDKWD